MPPKKKAAATAPTRKSSRNKAKADAQPAAPAAKPASGKKRARAPESDDEEVDSAQKDAKTVKKKPVSKKTKVDDDDEEEEAQVPTKKPVSKKSKANDDEDEDEAQLPKKKPVSKKNDNDQPKMVTVLKMGAAPTDPQAGGLVSTHQVYTDATTTYDCLLNQTNVGANANKFYVIQLLHPQGNNSHSLLFTRWGRVGENGQTQTKGPFAASQAVQEFKKQFKSKTGVNWEDRVGMVGKPGKYVWLERSFDDDEDEDKEATAESSSKKEAEKPLPSSLDNQVQDFCRLIFSTSIIEATLTSLNYDAKRLPLGKLSKATILNGFSALKNLSEVISDPNGDKAKALGGFKRATEDLTNTYYSIIPHAFGRNRPPIISDLGVLKHELDLVDALGDMEVASKLISSTIHHDDDGNPMNPLDFRFKSLNLTTMDPLSSTSQEFKALEGYVLNTIGQTHYNIKPNVKHIFRIERQAETEAWTAAGHDKLSDGERYLLWHGSRTSNFAGICSQGLRIAPPEAPVNGYMFGKGLYFADMFSKSANYCYASLSNNTGILLLCEVAVKPFYERYQAEYDADRQCKAKGKMCTLGLGRVRPTKWKDAGKATGNEELIGCHMPDGGGSDVNDSQSYLQYNEYIVYDTAQVKVKYLLMIGM